MSNYYRYTKHPKTGRFELAIWIDGFMGKSCYGVSFPSEPNITYHEDAFKWEFAPKCYVLYTSGFELIAEIPTEFINKYVSEHSNIISITDLHGNKLWPK